MNAEPLRIDIISDVVCPWCYVGKRRLERAMTLRPDIQFDVHWRPFFLNPLMPEDGLDRQTYVANKFGADKATAFYSQIQNVAKDEGIDFSYENIDRMPNTTFAHRLIYWAGSAGCQDEIVEGLFRGYFSEGKDIGQKDVLIEVSGAAGMERDLVAELLGTDRNQDTVLKEVAEAQHLGVTGVPCFIVGSRVPVMGAVDPEVLVRAFDTALEQDALEAEQAQATDASS